MRVLLITPFYAPGPGGSARLLQDIAEYLHQKKHTVYVLTYASAQAQAAQEFDEAQPYTIDRILPKKKAGGSSLAMALRVLLLLKQKRFDLIFCGVAYPSAILAYFARLMTRVPYVIYSHGEDVTSVCNAPRKAALLRRTLSWAQAIITNSSFTKAKVEAFGISSHKVICIPPGINVEAYENLPEDSAAVLRRRWGLEDKSIILTLARLTPRKGHDMIVRALPSLRKHVPNLHYLIVGHGDPTTLRDLANQEGVSDHVTFVDYVPDSDLPALFHLCDVYAMVSRWDLERNEVEGFGICYLEAGASGKPSVAGSAGGSPDAVEHNTTGLVIDPTSLEAVTQALLELLTDHDKAAAMGQAAHNRVRGTFSKDVLLPQIEQIILRNAS